MSTLAEFIDSRTKIPFESICSKWFGSHPAVYEQVRLGLHKWSIAQVHAWLRDDQGAPFSKEAFRQFVDRQGLLTYNVDGL